MTPRHNRIHADYHLEEIDQIRTASSKHENKHYKFSYAVIDRQSGDDFSHTQKQENGAVHGSYKTVLPDKRIQIVKYTADDVHGYRAEVSYENPSKDQNTFVSPQSLQMHYQPEVNFQNVVKQNHRFTPIAPYHHSSQIVSFVPSSSRY